MKEPNSHLKKTLGVYKQQAKVPVQGIKSSLEKVSTDFSTLTLDGLRENAESSETETPQSVETFTSRRVESELSLELEMEDSLETPEIFEAEEEKVEELLHFFSDSESNEVLILDWRLVSNAPAKKRILKRAISNKIIDMILKKKSPLTERIRHHLIQYQQHLNAIDDWSAHHKKLIALGFDLESEKLEKRARNHLKISRLQKLECLDHIKQLTKNKSSEAEIQQVFRLLDLVGSLYAKVASIVSFEVSDEPA
jgi:hypothetical protein